MEQFKKLGLSEEILKSIIEHKFGSPTEIQAKTIPLVLAGKDVIAGASTGSGKTLAFGAGIIQNCQHRKVIQALVLVPTRELADQVGKSIKMFSRYKHLEIAEIFGGVSMGPQLEKLETADVVVGTPGRILDHMSRGTIDFGDVKILVLDEADRMLDMGFRDDVEKIIQKCPKDRQTLLFSATISHDISKLANKYMDNPVEISAESYVDPSKLKQVYYDVSDAKKFSLLVTLLKEEHAGLIMVFCNTQRNTDFVANNLKENGINAVAIHGGLSQDKRTRIMGMFHSQKVSVLVCTDVAARGLDIKGVSHVYNYDSPRTSDEYIHRIGRTARAGEEGKAINILASRDYENFANIKKRVDFEIEKVELPEIQWVEISFRHRPRGEERRFGGSRGGNRGGFGGGRSRGGFSGGRSRFGGDRDSRRSDDGDGESRSFGNRRGFSSHRSERRDSRSRFSRHRRY